MSNSQPAPISGNVINKILYLETPGNNSRHVDKCCTAGLGNSLNMALFLVSAVVLYSVNTHAKLCWPSVALRRTAAESWADVGLVLALCL